MHGVYSHAVQTRTMISHPGSAAILPISTQRTRFIIDSLITHSLTCCYRDGVNIAPTDNSVEYFYIVRSLLWLGSFIRLYESIDTWYHRPGSFVLALYADRTWR